MATHPITAHDDMDGPTAAKGAQHGAHQLTVIAAGIPDLVQSSGGWLYDRARAGWAVNVLIDATTDVRPLRILGATPVVADAVSVLDNTSGGGLAVSADLLKRNARLRDQVLAMWKSGATDVTVWGQRWPEELGRRIDPEPHRLSVAARAFKAHALAAAAVPQRDVAATETLFDLGTQAAPPLRSV